MSASKVAAVMGTSPYESRFSLWLRMHGDLGPQEQTDVMSRGHYLEDAVVQWWQDQHHGIPVGPSACWRHDTEDWIATPDRVIEDGVVLLPLEIKTSANDDPEWGAAGTDQIPSGYRDQVQWQMHVMGAPRCHVAVLLPYLEFREYVVTYDPARCEVIEAEVRGFMASLDTGERPDLDAHGATYTALRAMHPDINPETVELDYDVAAAFCIAKAGTKAAKAADIAATSAVADAMGNAQKATWAGLTIATRRVKGEGVPYVTAASNLPGTLDVKESA